MQLFEIPDNNAAVQDTGQQCSRSRHWATMQRFKTPDNNAAVQDTGQQ